MKFEYSQSQSGKDDTSKELLCVRCSTNIVIGDYFTHNLSGHKMVCTGLVRRITDGKLVTTIELSDA